ncbi:MAG: hypothetical protein R2834_23030 [Rhodothermales bacterium]
MRHSRFDAQAGYVDTPEGIFTAEGIWFRVSEADLTAFAAPVLEHTDLGRLIAQAVRWCLAGQTAGLWSLLLFLYLTPAAAALPLAVLVFLLVQTFRPLLVSRWLDPVLKLLQALPAQALAYIVVLSQFGVQGAYSQVVVGIAGFVLFRWGLVERTAAPVLQRLTKRLYPIPMADQVLRSTIVRAAMRYRVSLPELDRIERQILQHLGGR